MFILTLMNPNMSRALEQAYGPVAAEFAVDVRPIGGAPEQIRDQWVGIELPIRSLYVARLQLGSIGRRFIQAPNDSARTDAITGEPLREHAWGPVEIVGHDAIDRLKQAERHDAAEYWDDYAEAIFAFRLFEGHFRSTRE